MLCCAQHKCGYPLSPRSAITVSLTVFPRLCLFIFLTSSFCTWKPVPPAPLHPRLPIPHPSPVATISLVFTYGSISAFYLFVRSCALFFHCEDTVRRKAHSHLQAKERTPHSSPRNRPDFPDLELRIDLCGS